jgi:hypothetical protein
MVKAEFILGLLGGIFGFFPAVLALGVGGLTAAFGGGTTIAGLGALAILASIMGIIGAAVSGGNPKVGGGLMVISAILGLIGVSFFYLLSAVLLFVGGIMALIKKSK